MIRVLWSTTPWKLHYRTYPALMLNSTRTTTPALLDEKTTSSAKLTGDTISLGVEGIPPRRRSGLYARMNYVMDVIRAHVLVQDPATGELPLKGSVRELRTLLSRLSYAMKPCVQNAQLRFVVGTMIVSFIVTGISAWLRLGPTSAFMLTSAIALALLIYSFRMRNLLLKRLLVFGLVVGLGELVSDYFCVVVNQTLVYPIDEPFLWVSPAYMPIAWMVLMVQFGTMADALTRRTHSLLMVTVLMSALGGIHIPIFETLANYAGVWSYHNTPLVFSTTPKYIILAEILLSASLPWMVSRVKRSHKWWQLSLLGLLQAAWILTSVVVAFWMVGR